MTLRYLDTSQVAPDWKNVTMRLRIPVKRIMKSRGGNFQSFIVNPARPGGITQSCPAILPARKICKSHTLVCILNTAIYYSSTLPLSPCSCLSKAFQKPRIHLSFSKFSNAEFEFLFCFEEAILFRRKLWTKQSPNKIKTWWLLPKYRRLWLLTGISVLHTLFGQEWKILRPQRECHPRAFGPRAAFPLRSEDFPFLPSRVCSIVIILSNTRCVIGLKLQLYSYVLYWLQT